MAKREKCNQADPGCAGHTQKECFSCGLPVCGSCSNLTQYLRYGRRRICANCQIEREVGPAHRARVSA